MTLMEVQECCKNYCLEAIYKMNPSAKSYRKGAVKLEMGAPDDVVSGGKRGVAYITLYPEDRPEDLQWKLEAMSNAGLIL